MTVDTHQHFWKIERGDYNWLTAELKPLYRDFLPEDLAPLMAATGVTGTIAVQAADSEEETEFLLSLADRYDWILGVVGWVDLEAEAAPSSIARLAAHPKLVGLRPMIQDIEDDAWMLRDALRPAIAAMIDHNLTFDALVLPRHLSILETFLARYPDLRVVIDHCAKPEIRGSVFQPWADDIAAIAELGRVYCKLSGLVTEAAENWQPKDLAPYTAHVIRAFGPEYLLFGSDWPVLNLASDYPTWFKEAQAVLSNAVPDLGRKNAFRAYPRLNI